MYFNYLSLRITKSKIFKDTVTFFVNKADSSKTMSQKKYMSRGSVTLSCATIITNLSRKYFTKF